MMTFPEDAEIYPLRLEPIVKEKPWGGHALARVAHKTLPPQVKIGETWEAWEGCTVANGRFQGRTLREVLAADARALLGDASGAAAAFSASHTSARDTGAHLPLLFKYIDANDPLSVQVHPDDLAAWEFERQSLGKTEAWYILHAEPGATVIHGFSRPASLEMIRAGLAQNTLAELLAAVRVRRGDVVFVPAGTIHAIGKGIVLAEIQQSSDTTYRLYDWDRRDETGRPRELHVDKALRVTEYDVPGGHLVPALSVTREYGEQQYLVACRYFALERLALQRAARPFALGGKFHILAFLSGEAQITFGPSGAWQAGARAGETFVVPAGLEQYGLSPSTPECELLRMYVPALSADVVEPLLAAGFDRERIARLGGPIAQHNDLRALL